MIKIEDMLLAGESVTLKATGRSMRPTFRDRKDFVTLSPCDRAKLQVGDVVFFNRGDQWCLHRIIEIDGDNLIIRGDGNQPGALEKAKRDDVAGKVTAGTMRGGHPFEETDRKWQVNTRRVMRLYPLIALFHRVLDIIRHYPLSLIVLGVLFYLSFMNPSKIAAKSFVNADKLAHFLMYSGVSLVFWFEWLRVHGAAVGKARVKGFLFCVILPIVIGGVIEIMQEQLTGGRRSGDWMDFLADITGVVAATAVSLIIKSIFYGKKN